MRGSMSVLCLNEWGNIDTSEGEIWGRKLGFNEEERSDEKFKKEERCW